MASSNKAHKPSLDPHPLAQVAHAEDSDDEKEPEANILGDGMRSPALQLMKSPELRDLESPDLSSEPNSSDDEDEGGVPANTGTSHLAEVMAAPSVSTEKGSTPAKAEDSTTKAEPEGV